MITSLVACLLAAQPLAVTGSDAGLWYVGDQEPGLPNKAPHEICTRVTETTYQALQPLMHRPVAMVVDDQTLWFTDDGVGILLYRMRLHQTAGRGTPMLSSQNRAVFCGFLESALVPTDIVMLDGYPVVACGGSTLDLLAFVAGEWETLPTLDVNDAQVTQIQNRLIAASPHKDGVIVWVLEDDRWTGGDVIALEGTLVDLITRDDWPILVLEDGDIINVVGLQHGDPVDIASFQKPKGGWGVAPSMTGLSLVGVERIGTTTVIDIGWPSGDLSDAIVLEEQFGSTNPFVTALTFAIPLVMMLVMLSWIRRLRQKTPN